jgi:Tfp pilus assembly PilM family ATPase
MNWIPSRSRRGPIGLDIGSRCVKAVQLAGQSGAWRIAAASSIPRTPDEPKLTEAEVQRITAVLRRQGFTGDSVVAAVPGEKLLTGILDVPPRDSGAPVEQIARMELATMHRTEAGSFEMAWWELPAGRGREGSRIMAAACPHAVSEEMIALLESGGLEVAAIDTECAALARVCDATADSFQRVSPVLDLGWRAARLVLLQQGTIVYERRLSEAGLGPLWHAITSQFNLEPRITDYLMTTVGLGPAPGETPDDADDVPQLDEVRHLIGEHFEPMTREILSSLAYAEHQYPAAAGTKKSAMIIGGGAGIPGLAERFTQKMEVEVRRVSPAQRGVCGPRLANLCQSPALTIAMGLAMHEVDA